jgi:hypothetical protein
MSPLICYASPCQASGKCKHHISTISEPGWPARCRWSTVFESLFLLSHFLQHFIPTIGTWREDETLRAKVWSCRVKLGNLNPQIGHRSGREEGLIFETTAEPVSQRINSMKREAGRFLLGKNGFLGDLGESFCLCCCVKEYSTEERRTWGW